MSMKKFKYSSIVLSSLLVATSSFSGGAGAQGTSTTTPQELAKLYGNVNVQSSAPTSVIVELTAESLVEAKSKGKAQSQGNLAKERQKVKDAVKKASKSSKVNKEYDYVFSGFSVELPASEVPALLSIPGVKAVYPNVEYTVTSTEGSALSAEEFSPMMANSAPFIGSNDAWDAGYTGEGVTVAVLDTGVDYTHPDLDHAFGDYKGWDLVDNDNDPQETPVGDPRGAATTHGTHVAGTVAANGQIKGVAPDATLLSYRVLGPGGSGSTENVVAGIEKAVEDGADIMNLSLGNSLNNPDWATSIALDWAMEEGVVAVTSNGNSGPNNWTVGSPGTSREAISVGATQLPFNLYNAALTTDAGTYASAAMMGYTNSKDVEALNGQTLELVDAGFGQVSDFAKVDVKGKVAVISRGVTPFVDKAQAAKDAGAVAAIIYNNVGGEISFVIPGMAVPTVKLSDVDGKKLLEDLKAGNKTVKLDLPFASQQPELVADFSSRGPVVDTWMIKPDVSAPGVDIVSTIPGNAYGSKQGTSMASPHVAGAAALILEAHPTWNVDDVKAALMNTAVNLVDATGKDYPHNTQGAGSIRPLEAINTTTLVTPGSHSYGVFSKNKGKQVEKQHFTLKNLSNERKTYSFDVKFDGAPAGIKVSASNNLKVNAGQIQKVNLNVQVDAGKLTPGYYEGTIVVSDGESTYDLPTILFVQEPDYARVSSVGVGVNADGSLELSGYFPGGAETVDWFVYESNAAGAPVKYLGDVGLFENVGKGFQGFNWDGTLTNGVKLEKGKYYNVYAYATYKGVETLSGGNFLYK